MCISGQPISEYYLKRYVSVLYYKRNLANSTVFVTDLEVNLHRITYSFSQQPVGVTITAMHLANRYLLRANVCDSLFQTLGIQP